MPTVSTINPTKDNWLAEANPTSKYGGGALVQIGVSGSVEYMNGIFEFDVSGYSNPSDVVSAIFTLTASASVGTAKTMTLARLSQDFGETTSNYNTYDGTNTWATGGTGDAQTTETTYTFGVGTTADISVDIKELVIDAVTRRSGVLRFICFLNATPSASGYTKFYSRSTGAGTPPTLAITVATRISWTGERSGDLAHSGNWTATLGVPTANDIALFNENGTNNPNENSLTCSRCYFGRNFSQDFGSSTVSLTITADKIFADTQAQLFIKSTADEFHIRSAKQITDGCVLSGTTGSVYISNCEAEVRFHTTAAISNIYIMSGSRINPTTNTSTGIVSQVIIGEGADDANVICEGRFNVTDNSESDDISLYGGGKYVLNNTAEDDGIENLTIASGSVCEFNATEIQTALTMYGGTFTIEDNENAQLDLPTTITNYLGTLNLNNGLDSANAAAFTGTTFTGYASTLILGKTSTLTISA